MEYVMTYVGPALDVAAVVLLAAVLWRLGGDPSAGWGAHEARLREIFDDLRALVAQSEGLARDLDEKLATREARLTALVAEARGTLAGAHTHGAVAEAHGIVGDAPARGADARERRIEVRDEAAVDADPRDPTEDPGATAARIETLADTGVAVEEIARQVGVAAAEVRLVIGLKAARTARRRMATAEAAHA